MNADLSSIKVTRCNPFVARSKVIHQLKKSEVVMSEVVMSEVVMSIEDRSNKIYSEGHGTLFLDVEIESLDKRDSQKKLLTSDFLFLTSSEAISLAKSVHLTNSILFPLMSLYLMNLWGMGLLKSSKILTIGRLNSL